MKTYLHEMTSKEAGAALEKCEVVIIPIGSAEWHGPHLPLCVDHETSRAFAKAAAERMYPQVLYTHSLQGVVRGQMQWPGSITIPPHAFIEIMVGTCQSLNYHGVGRILILNGHGSNRPQALAAAIRASKEFDMQVVTASWWDLTPSSAREEIMEGNHVPGHAGDTETSLMMYLRPELVNVEEALKEDWPPELDGGRAGVAHWIEAGIGKSTPEKGKAIYDLTLEHMVAWLEDFIAGKTSVVEPRSDREGYTIEFLGTRLWYFWAETNQQFMEQFRSRFRDKAGRLCPGIELDAWGNPVEKK